MQITRSSKPLSVTLRQSAAKISGTGSIASTLQAPPMANGIVEVPRLAPMSTMTSRVVVIRCRLAIHSRTAPTSYSSNPPLMNSGCEMKVSHGNAVHRIALRRKVISSASSPSSLKAIRKRSARGSAAIILRIKWGRSVGEGACVEDGAPSAWASMVTADRAGDFSAGEITEEGGIREFAPIGLAELPILHESLGTTRDNLYGAEWRSS